MIYKGGIIVVLIIYLFLILSQNLSSFQIILWQCVSISFMIYRITNTKRCIMGKITTIHYEWRIGQLTVWLCIFYWSLSCKKDYQFSCIFYWSLSLKKGYQFSCAYSTGPFPARKATSLAVHVLLAPFLQERLPV